MLHVLGLLWHVIAWYLELGFACVFIFVGTGLLRAMYRDPEITGHDDITIVLLICLGWPYWAGVALWQGSVVLAGRVRRRLRK